MIDEQKPIKKGDDGELSSILIACGVFTLALLIVDFTYGNMHALISSWIKWPFIVIHVALFISWGITIAYRSDPNLDFMRWVTIFLAISGLILILAHRNAWLDDEDFKKEVNQNKQEQIIPDSTISKW